MSALIKSGAPSPSPDARMSQAILAQSGILHPIPAHGRYLSCQQRVGADPRTVL